MSQQVVINSFSGIGPICILLDTNTQQTILDLKKHVTERTSIPTTFQCIKNLSGRSLKDQDSIFINDKQGGPIVFNIKIIASSWKPAYVLNNNNNNNSNNNNHIDTPTFSKEEYHISKYTRRQDIGPLIMDNNNNNSNNNNNNDNDNDNDKGIHNSIITCSNNNINNDNTNNITVINNIHSPINNSTTTTVTLRTATMIFNPNDTCHLHMASMKGKSKETRKRKSYE